MTFTEFGDLHPCPDYSECRCNFCGLRFEECDILVEDESGKEYCPACYKTGYIESMGEPKD